VIFASLLAWILNVIELGKSVYIELLKVIPEVAAETGREEQTAEGSKITSTSEMAVKILM